MQVDVRAAAIADAEPIGRLHVLAWQAAYAGLLPADYLDGLDAAARAEMWRQALSRPRDLDPVLVAVIDGEVVGFASYGPVRDAPGSTDGELYSLNIRPDRWGCGAGGALLSAVHTGLAGLGHGTAVLWVYPHNDRARAVYEHRGWHHDGAERTTEIFGITVPEVRYRRNLP